MVCDCEQAVVWALSAGDHMEVNDILVSIRASGWMSLRFCFVCFPPVLLCAYIVAYGNACMMASDCGLVHVDLPNH